MRKINRKKVIAEDYRRQVDVFEADPAQGLFDAPGGGEARCGLGQ